MSVCRTDNCAPRVVVALDFPQASLAFDLVKQLDPALCRLKVGKELFVNGGPQLVERLVSLGYDLFLDLKFHDIPNTVSSACRAAADLGVWMVNVHCCGGRRMMEAASEALASRSTPPLLIGVTVLTSLEEHDLAEVGIGSTIDQQVLRLARLATDCGLDGVVCSPLETRTLRRELGDGICLVTPGIRPAESTKDDQRRVTTPADALRLGSDYLVIGRPVTQAEDPLALLESINRQLDTVIDEG